MVVVSLTAAKHQALSCTTPDELVGNADSLSLVWMNVMNKGHIVDAAIKYKVAFHVILGRLTSGECIFTGAPP
eukprot:m.50269 g.50269  ORF g.50269 m.50269 type:complete len:73 (-) comp10657_c0_seq3:34-252(-)